MLNNMLLQLLKNCTEQNCISLDNYQMKTMIKQTQQNTTRKSGQLSNEDNDQIDSAEHNQEEWMFLCQLQPTYDIPNSPGDDNVDWEEAARQLTPSLLLSCPNWIKQINEVSIKQLQLQKPTTYNSC